MRAQCAQLLGEGLRPAEVARRTGVNESTLRKAIKRKAIVPVPQGAAASEAHLVATAGTTNSERSRDDALAASGMGVACTRADDRLTAAVDLSQSATARFEAGRDVQMAGVLAGLPALCANGLLSVDWDGIWNWRRRGSAARCTSCWCWGSWRWAGFVAPRGCWHIPPGELGNAIGLDRVPEVRTLRAKIAELACTGDPGAWMQELSQNWMEGDPDEAGYLYVDGHVRVYDGELANLPRRYVSRQRLCLRGTTDYWVNDALGRPFFVVSKAVTAGLSEALLEDIVPELLASVPAQPTAAELKRDPLLHRFVIVFDREGATHSLLGALWEQRIGALTYRKNVKDVWPEAEFVEQEVVLPSSGSTRMKLAVRRTELTATGKAAIPVTEVRRLTETGHQSAVITPAQRLDSTLVASRMFSRWCQENFFAYMMQHYDIDGLIEYGVQELPGTLLVVNPAWRERDRAVAKARRQVQKWQVQVAASTQRQRNIRVTFSAHA